MRSSIVFDGNLRVFGHRGAPEMAPELTLAGFAAALEVGADGVELDVRLCRTGEVVVIHDATLGRTTDGHGFVRKKSLSELKQYDAGSYYHPRFAGERIPTLAEVLELIDQRGLINVEIKGRGYPKDDIERKVLDVIYRYGVEDRTIISSFNPIILRRVARLDPEMPTGYLIDRNFSVGRSEQMLARLSGAQALHLHSALLRPSLVQRVREKGFHVVVWDVDTSEEMHRAIELGVDAVITDRPSLMKRLLTETAA